jgi:hypothetical protein
MLPLAIDNQRVDLLFHTVRDAFHQARCSCSGISQLGYLFSGLISAISSGMRQRRRKRGRLINFRLSPVEAIGADQNSFEPGSRSGRWHSRCSLGPASDRRPGLVCRFLIANRKAWSFLQEYEECREYFLRSRVPSNSGSLQRRGEPHDRRLG